MRKSRSETAMESRARIVPMRPRLFLAEGISSAGTREIMSASGIAQGGFYRHFDSKSNCWRRHTTRSSQISSQCLKNELLDYPS